MTTRPNTVLLDGVVLLGAADHLTLLRLICRQETEAWLERRARQTSAAQTAAHRQPAMEDA
jgi:hypothetical protein